MTTIREIEDRVDALSERVRRLHSGDWVAIGYHSGSWWVRSHYLTGVSREGASPSGALEAFERALTRKESMEDIDTLAATLGVEAAQ